ncbi:MAG: class I SAM-dependent methyltransferase [Armatimonadota bacterium]
MQTREFEELYELEETYWWFVGRRWLVRELLEEYAPEPRQRPRRIVDIGCGTGGTMKALEGTGEIFGCDVSRTALTFCRRRGFQRLVCSYGEALGLADEAFDVVVNCDVLEHIEGDVEALAEMFRVLRPGGIVILTVPAHPYLWSEHDEALAHLRRYRRSEFESKLQEAGYSVEKLSAAVFFVFPVILTFRLLQRLLPKKPGEPKTDLRILPTWLNNTLISLLHLETWLTRRINLPIGTSFVAVARKPE